MKTYLIVIYFLLFIYSSINAEFCRKEDCRGGDCEIIRLANGLLKKTCHCVKGVCGETCQRLCNSTSQCTANPCWFGSTCVDIANLDYVCLCPPNHTGKDCRTIISCQTNICQNGGKCVQTVYGARCDCSENFQGDFCQYEKVKKINENTNSQVEYRQIDTETLAMIANLGAENINQQRAISFAIAMGNRSQFVFCLANPCENGGTCFVTNTATTKGICICREGFVGDYCENLYNRTVHGSRDYAGYCASNPCLNDGTCVEVGAFNGYCRCSPEYRGAYCETSARSMTCNPNPCKNGGTCVLMENNQAQCLCTAVFRGTTCSQFSYIPCGDATCHGTQGVCVANKCVCKTGFAGPRCDSTDFCAAFPCLNGGTCVQTNEEPYGGCSCPSEFSGPTCSNDPCNPSPCLNGGRCIRKQDNQFYCQCRNKNKGVYCEQVECFPSDATVDVQGVGKVRLSALKLGEHVRVLDEKNQIIYSPIIAFLHRDLNEHTTYKRLRTKNARLELSDRHLIHRRHDGFIWAEQLNEGDEILILANKHANQTTYETILEIDEVEKQGLLAPLTEQGTILVNNVHTSCYAIVKSHTVGHLALAPYRIYRRMIGGLSDNQIAPILSYANILFQVFRNFPIVKDLIF